MCPTNCVHSPLKRAKLHETADLSGPTCTCTATQTLEKDKEKINTNPKATTFPRKICTCTMNHIIYFYFLSTCTYSRKRLFNRPSQFSRLGILESSSAYCFLTCTNVCLLPVCYYIVYMYMYVHSFCLSGLPLSFLYIS